MSGLSLNISQTVFSVYSDGRLVLFKQTLCASCRQKPLPMLLRLKEKYTPQQNLQNFSTDDVFFSIFFLSIECKCKVNLMTRGTILISMFIFATT